jgi:hypothetical protein
MDTMIKFVVRDMPPFVSRSRRFAFPIFHCARPDRRWSAGMRA